MGVTLKGPTRHTVHRYSHLWHRCNCTIAPPLPAWLIQNNGRFPCAGPFCVSRCNAPRVTITLSSISNIKFYKKAGHAICIRGITKCQCNPFCEPADPPNLTLAPRGLTGSFPRNTPALRDYW
ncbi:hypothetical protein FKM82_017916 [Ascaphus truei]